MEDDKQTREKAQQMIEEVMRTLFDESPGEMHDNIYREDDDYEYSDEGLRGGRLYLGCITCRRMVVIMHRERLEGEKGSNTGYKCGWELTECGRCEMFREQRSKWQGWLEERKKDWGSDAQAGLLAVVSRCKQDGGQMIAGKSGYIVNRRMVFQKETVDLAMRSVRVREVEGSVGELEMLGYVEMEFLG